MRTKQKNTNHSGSSENAVDGDRSGIYRLGSCTLTCRLSFSNITCYLSCGFFCFFVFCDEVGAGVFCFCFVFCFCLFVCFF